MSSFVNKMAQNHSFKIQTINQNHKENLIYHKVLPQLLIRNRNLFNLELLDLNFCIIELLNIRTIEHLNN